MKVCLSVFVLAVALAIGFSSLASAHQVVVGKLKIGHPWVREAAEGAPGTYSCIIEGATIEGAGTGVLYKLIESGGHYTSRPFEEGLVIKPHGSIELTPSTYQFKFGRITKKDLRGRTQWSMGPSCFGRSCIACRSNSHGRRG